MKNPVHLGKTYSGGKALEAARQMSFYFAFVLIFLFSEFSTAADVPVILVYRPSPFLFAVSLFSALTNALLSLARRLSLALYFRMFFLF